MGFEPGDGFGRGAGHFGQQLTVCGDPEGVVVAGDGDSGPGVDLPTWIFCPATMMTPREETRRSTAGGVPGTAGGGPAGLRSRSRVMSVTGLGRVGRRHPGRGTAAMAVHGYPAGCMCGGSISGDALMARWAANVVETGSGGVPVQGWANGPNLNDPHSVPGHIGAIVFGLLLCLTGLVLVFGYRGFAESQQESRTLPVWCFRLMGAWMGVSGVYMAGHGIALLL